MYKNIRCQKHIRNTSCVLQIISHVSHWLFERLIVFNVYVRKHNNHNTVIIMLWNKKNSGPNEIPSGEMGYGPKIGERVFHA